MRILITGGAGFIGSALIRYILRYTEHIVFNIDKLTYAGNLESLDEVLKDKNLCEGRYYFSQTDVCDEGEVEKIIFDFKPQIIMHLAAESHVDRSIDGPKDFIMTNIFGTFNMLQKARKYWLSLDDDKRQRFRFHHISTDEVFGSLEEGFFTETSAYRPNSPYSASKASADHLVRVWYKTFNLPTIITNCSNNYGPYQFPEKLIPLMILNALEFKPLPVYGDGKNVRDWLYVDDHVRALLLVVEKGRVGQTYNIGGNCEKQNIEVVQTICDILDEMYPDRARGSRRKLITFVEDRPAHDRRYAIDASKIRKELGFYPQETFESGIRKTIKWYVDNPVWVERVCSGKYRRERLGVLNY